MSKTFRVFESIFGQIWAYFWNDSNKIKLVIKNCKKMFIIQVPNNKLFWLAVSSSTLSYYKIFDSFYQSSKMVQVLESWKDLGRLWETNISHSGICSNSITPFNRIQRLEITVNQQLHVQIWSLRSSFTFVTVAIKWEIFYPNWIEEVLTLNVWFTCTVKGTAKWIWDRSIFYISFDIALFQYF